MNGTPGHERLLPTEAALVAAAAGRLDRRRCHLGAARLARRTC